MVDKNSPLPLYVQLRDTLRAGVESGEYPAGSQLPTEQELGRRYGLGRATVRSALDLLLRDGVIEKRRGVGTFVRAPRRSFSFEPLLSLTGFLQGLGIATSNRLLKSGWVKADAALAARARTALGARLGTVLRLRSALGQPVALEHSYFSAPVFEQMRLRPLDGSLSKLLLRDLHLEVARIEQTILRREPLAAERRALCLAPDQQVIELTRWLYAPGETVPFYYIEFIVTAGAYEDLAASGEGLA